MSSTDDAIQSTDPIEQVGPSFNHRNSVSERRQSILQQKQTDHLPTLGADMPNAKLAWRQMMQLREENKRLRGELANYDKELAELHSNQQQEMEQLQLQVQELTGERDKTKDDLVQLEHRYQELYHTFQSEVEEEAERLVEEAARTLVLTPENRPRTRTDLLKTVELHVRQAEDRQTAEALYLMRQAQRKATQLEQELLAERQQIATERQNIYNIQQSAREQAELRKRMITERLQARYTLTLTLMTSVLLILLPIFQVIIFSFLHLPLTPLTILAMVAPLLLCFALAAVFSYLRTNTRAIVESAPHKQKAEPQKESK